MLVAVVAAPHATVEAPDRVIEGDGVTARPTDGTAVRDPSRSRARMLGPAGSQGRESRLARRGADVPVLPPVPRGADLCEISCTILWWVLQPTAC